LKPPARPSRADRPGRAWILLGCFPLLAALGPAPAPAQSWKQPAQRPAAASPASNQDAVPFTPTPAAAPVRDGLYSNLGLLDRLTREAVRDLADSLRLDRDKEVTILSTTWHEANWFVGSLLAETLAERNYRVRVAGWGSAADTARGAAPAPAQGGGTPPPAGGEAPAPAGAGAGQSSYGGTADDDDEDRPVGTGALEDTTGAYADSVLKAQEDPLWGSPSEEPEPPVVAAPGTPQPRATAAAVGPGSYPEGQVLDLRIVEFGVHYPDGGRKLLFGPMRFTRVGGVFLQVSTLQGPAGDFRQMTSAERHEVDRLTGSQRALVEGASYPFNPPVLKTPSLGRYIEPTVVVAIVGSLVYLFYANQN